MVLKYFPNKPVILTSYTDYSQKIFNSAP